MEYKVIELKDWNDDTNGRKIADIFCSVYSIFL